MVWTLNTHPCDLQCALCNQEDGIRKVHDKIAPDNHQDCEQCRLHLGLIHAPDHLGGSEAKQISLLNN